MPTVQGVLVGVGFTPDPILKKIYTMKLLSLSLLIFPCSGRAFSLRKHALRDIIGATDKIGIQIANKGKLLDQ